MIETAAIGEIIATYQKHGWILRRVLLSAALEKRLGNGKNTLFGAAPLVNADIDAAWFSRPPTGGGVAWEIRYLGDIAFALLEHIDEDNADFEAALHTVEARLRETIAIKESA